ncbi:MAG: PHP domain-containing protein [Firmicutes bacterium]|nr:PHP domain-containing protein [Bacillota bacterium]
MPGFDMHIHSTASDGYYNAEEIIDLALATNNVNGIAITDHDTVAALPQASAYAKKLNYPLIPGIELSAEYEGCDVHILGYWIDIAKMAANDDLKHICQAREERFRQMANRLAALNMPVAVETLIAESAQTQHSLGRPHLAQAMVKAGYAENVREAFRKWLSRDMPAYVPRFKLSPFEALHMIAQAFGIAVLAHPGTGAPDNLIKLLAQQGLGGIEVYHSEHNKAAEKKYLRMAQHYHLAAIGGSDFHMVGQRSIGCRLTMPEQLTLLKQARITQKTNRQKA